MMKEIKSLEPQTKKLVEEANCCVLVSSVDPKSKSEGGVGQFFLKIGVWSVFALFSSLCVTSTDKKYTFGQAYNKNTKHTVLSTATGAPLIN